MNRQARVDFAGASSEELLASMAHRIKVLDLDLSGLNVVTEAATGAYACTAVIAALAGARKVHAIARDTALHGRFEDAEAATLDLAVRAGVAERIQVSRKLTPDMLGSCSILTNSGHLRPITRKTINQLPPDAVIALMFEAWEFRETDLDIHACRQRGIKVAAVNERHPAVGVFPFLGPLAVRLLMDAERSASDCRVALICENAFAPFIRAGLSEAGALVSTFDSAGAVPAAAWDVVLVALDPSRHQPLGEAALAPLAEAAPAALLAQFWGDIDRAAASIHFSEVWPPLPPAKGHMAILLTALGHEPIVRLQAGGLRAAEIVHRRLTLQSEGIADLL